MNTIKNQDKILTYLKMNGQQTISALAKHFGMTSEGMRLHLIKLEEEGLVSSESIIKGVGRPIIQFSLTEKGSKRFPDNHANLTVQLLENIRDILGQNALDELIVAKKETDFTRYEKELHEIESIDDKIELFTTIRTNEGYMAELDKEPNGWSFIENHCPICSAVSNCQGFCESEIENIKRLLGDTISIEREEHAAIGDRRCVYHIKKQDSL
jgi:predicted ArsR family transcriptional regulator